MRDEGAINKSFYSLVTPLESENTKNVECNRNKAIEGPMRETLLNKQVDYDNEEDRSSGGSRSSHSHFTPILCCSTFTAASGTFAYGYVMAYSAPTQSRIVKELSLSVSEYSFFGSVVTIGGLCGAIVSGKLSDLLGRKLMICVIDLIWIAGWLAIGFAKGAGLLDFGRFLSGLASGISAYLAPIYLAELAPKNLRGKLLAIVMLMTACGMSFVDLVGSIIHWRVLALIGIIPCVSQLITVYFVPESPRWLAKVGKKKELEAALICLRGVESHIIEEATEIKENVSALQHISRNGIFDMFQQKYARVLMAGIGLMLLQQLGGLNGYSFYTDTIFVSAGISSQLGFALTALIQILMSILSVVLIDRYGRKPLLMGSAVGAFLGSALTGIAFMLQDTNQWKEATPIIALISVMVYTGAYGFALGGLPWIVISEILPINIKGSAGSLFSVVSNICSWIVSYTFNFMVNWSSSGTFFLYALVNGLGVFFIAKLLPETKGRTLEEIQASLTDHVLQ